jgi:hypothetical protein
MGNTRVAQPPVLRTHLQLIVGIRAMDIYNNVMYLVLDSGVVMPSNITVCYTLQCGWLRMQPERRRPLWPPPLSCEHLNRMLCPEW